MDSEPPTSSRDNRETLRNAGSHVISSGGDTRPGSQQSERLIRPFMLGPGELEEMLPKEPGYRPSRGTIKYTGPLGRIRLPGSHWTENPMALEMMKAMSFSYTVPSLQPRLTKFHGTRVPVLMLFFLFSTEVGRLAALDTFWKRIVQHAMVWQGLYCRDYCSKRCVWQTLHGRAGSKMCLYHIGNTHPSEFVEICKQITAIPGRSDEELMGDYCNWRLEQKAVFAALDARRTADLTSISEDCGMESPISSRLLPDVLEASSVRQERPRPVRADVTYRLGNGHACAQPHSKQLRMPKPVLRAAAWSRESPAGRPPKQTTKQIGSVPPTWTPTWSSTPPPIAGTTN
mmetsp:Transcript_686/g.1047  ORF Transcript_686/g.1047 Transcript_686/m.1047 type:complete len:344 (+) Transcript_686:91-1122(+)